ncbi:MAG: hypothetical protein AB7O38_30335, partial [Pirellulaceae bacterium]
MKRTWIGSHRAAWILAAPILAALALACPVASFAEEGKWVSLFDGKSLEGWTVLELGKQPGMSHWEVKDGVIEGSGL